MKKKYNFLANLFMYLTIIVFSIISVIFLITSNAFLFLIAFLILVWISIKNNIKHFPILLFVLCFFYSFSSTVAAVPVTTTGVTFL